MDSDTIEWSEKEPVLDDFKEMIDCKNKNYIVKIYLCNFGLT